jgi:hypothetical protein
MREGQRFGFTFKVVFARQIYHRTLNTHGHRRQVLQNVEPTTNFHYITVSLWRLKIFKLDNCGISGTSLLSRLKPQSIVRSMPESANAPHLAT